MALQPISAPINLNETSVNVANLQSALVALGFAISKDELSKQTAGPQTTRAVRDFQSQNKIQFDDKFLVDEITASALNTALKSKGLFDETKTYTVTGVVLNDWGEVLSGKNLMAFDIDLRGAKIYKTAKTLDDIKSNNGMQALGNAVSLGDGSYSISFTDAQFNAAEMGLADVIVYAVQDNTITGRSELSTIDDYINGVLLNDWNVLISATADRGISEFTRLLQQVNSMLRISNMQLSELFGSDDQAAFLASEINQGPEKVGFLINAAQLAQSFPNNPEAHQLLYGLGREQITLTFSSIGLTEESKILDAWQLAIDQNIIDSIDARTLNAFLAILHQYAAKQMLTGTQTGEIASLTKTLSFATTDTKIQSAFLTASRTFSGSAEDFWNTYLPSLPEFSGQPQLIKSFQLTNQLVVLTANHLPLVQVLQIDRKIQDPIDLLSFTDNDWNDLLKQSGIPDGVSGNTNDEKIANYKNNIQAILNAAYPTQKIYSMINGNQLKLENADVKNGLISFFSAAKNFDIKSSRINDFQDQLNTAGGQNMQLLKDNLAKIQRLYSVSPTPDALSKLMDAKFHSANQIANIPQQAFINMNSDILGGQDIAFAIHQRASFQTMRMEKLAAVINESAYALSPQIMRPAVAAQQAIIQSKVPNWTELFGSPDSCECEECRSVYGAAAYLVDIMQFLDKLDVNDFNKSPLAVLLQRRPDIAYLPLTCENTNTIIPYIDLVNEIMEYYVAHGLLDDKSAYDTGDSTADELRANPQNTLKEAYSKLKDAIYPFSLPYHQPLDVERIYYDQMRTTRSEVMTAFQTDFSDTTNRAIHAEQLNISQEEYQILTGKDFAANDVQKNLWEYYGYSNANDFQSNIYKVPEFSRRTGINYTDTINLLQTQFINPGQTILDYIEDLFSSSTLSSSDIYQKLKAIAGGADPAADADIMTVLNAKAIAPADFKTWAQNNFIPFQHIITSYQNTSNCDLASTELRILQNIYENPADPGIPANVLNDIFPKIQSFIRLWNRLQWNIFELDALIGALGEKNITNDLVDKISIVKTINDTTHVSLDKLATIWGNIQTAGKNALYIKLFLNRTIQKIDVAFQANPWGAYLSDATQLIKDHLTAIQAAFRINGEDLNLVITDSNLVLNTAILNIENLSIIYRYIMLAKALSVSINDLTTIKKLFGINPFSNFDTAQNIFTDINPKATLDFITLVSNIKSSGFSVSALNYILGDIADPQHKLDMPDEAVQDAMIAIRKSFSGIDNDNPDSDLQNNITEDLLRSKLQLIYQGDIVDTLISIIKGTAIFSTITDKNIPVTILSPQNNYVSYSAGSGRLQCTAVLSDADKTALGSLSGATANFQSAVQDLYKQPEQFLTGNFSALFVANMNDAIASLLNHPSQAQALSVQDKFNWFYKYFLPYLKKQLHINIVVQSISTVIGLDEPSTQILLQSQLDALVQTISITGLDATYYTDENFTTSGLSRNDNQIDFSWGMGSPDPAIPADHFSVRWEGYLNPPTSGDYTLTVEADAADDAFRLFLDDQLLVEKHAGDALLSWEDVIPLAMSQAYKFKIEYIEQTGVSGIHVYWKTNTTAKQIISTGNLYPLKLYNDLFDVLKKLQKASIFINAFNLKSAEINHFIQFSSNFNNIDFNALTHFHWQRIYDYASLVKSVPSSSSSFIDLFQLANRNNPVPVIDDIIAKTILVTGWNTTSISSLVKNHFNFQVADFKNEIALRTLLKAVKLIQKAGVAADALSSWSTPQTDFDQLNNQAQEIKNAVKAQLEDQDWLIVAKKLSNKLRENQKNALIQFLLVQPELIQWGVVDADSLYEYFLIDVQMCSCMDTSRLVQATAAVQLFVSRCLLNVESKPDNSGKETSVSPGQIDKSGARWEWMQYYRVWEANRKVFLYPENWLDPELRTDKSPFFKELESELLQNDITQDSVDDAFYNYLNKLDEVSHLDICGMYQENDGQGNMKTLHVFGRTHGKPHTHYYRTCDDKWHWSAWDKVPVDIKGVDSSANSNAAALVASGVHLAPVIWKDRLFIFWPEFLKKQFESSATTNNTSITNTADGSFASLKQGSYWEVSLGWSEYKNGKWTPKNVSKEFLHPGTEFLFFNPKTNKGFDYAPFEPDLKNYSLMPVIDNQNQLTVSLIYKRQNNHGRFILSDIHNPIQIGYSIHGVFISKANSGQNTAPVYNFSLISKAAFFFEPDYSSYFMQLEKNYKLILKGNIYLQSSIDHRIIYSPQENDFEQTLNYPFFYMDDSRSYFVRTSTIAYLRHAINILTRPERNAFVPAQAAKYSEIPNLIPKLSVDPEPVNFASADNATRSSVVTARATGSALATTSSKYQVAKANSVSQSSFAWNKDASLLVLSPYIFDKGLTFYTNYHPYSQQFIRALNTKGIDGLMESDTIMYDNNNVAFDPDDHGSLFENTYQPNHTKNFVAIPTDLATISYYKENVAFDEFAPYGLYNWELFFHAPLYIATRLSKNGKYQEAMKWFQYIFDPTTSDKPTDPNFPESRYWKVLPFKTTQAQSLLDYFESLQPGQDDAHIDDWKDHPFEPFRVALDRPIAFMKNVVMKYIDNLVAWGDDLFRTDTRENINTATQLYIIAAHILGPRPEKIPSRGKLKAETYNSLKPKLDDFSNAMVDLENLFPYSSEISLTDNPYPGSMLGVGSTLYFCIPDNDNLLQYWDTVADRLFKIRHCMNIEGVERSLALFAPPIDPGLLIRATASGLSIGSILADMNSPAPLYRFGYLVQKATEFCAEVKALGSALLVAIEKKESEELARIRASHETTLLNMITQVKQRQILDAKATKQNLEANRATVVKRIQYYIDLLGITGYSIPTGPESLPGDIDQDYALPDTSMNAISLSVDVSLVDTNVAGVKVIPKEKEDLDKTSAAHLAEMAAQVAEAIAGPLHLVPSISVDAKPFGVGGSVSFGGQNLGGAESAFSSVMRIFGAQYAYEAGKAARMSSFIRRDQESTQQANQGLSELLQIDKQLLAADIRIQISEKELENHQRQIDNAQEIEDYLQNQLQGHTKFTTQEFYLWMKEQLFSVYKQSYQMAFDLARKAEKAYQFEIGNPNTNFIQYGYFDSTYQGLTAGEQLHFAIKQLEKSFIEQNKREFELTKHISLAMTRPDLLLQIKETGSCEWAWPEELFDMDYPGHYFRRIKSVQISIPCVVGPYVTVNATLRLLDNSIRINTANGDNGYEHNNDNGILTDDDRFTGTKTPFVAIATSSAQNDSGVFELNFRDERYLPFEGAGVISKWKLELNGKYLQDDGTILDISQFDFDTISDIIIHLHYTSREDAGQFRQSALAHVQEYFQNIIQSVQPPLMQLFSARHDFPTEWYRFLHPVNNTDGQALTLDINKMRFPFFTQKKIISITSVELAAESNLSTINNMQLISPDPATDSLNLIQDGKFGNLLHASKVYTGSGAGTWIIKNPNPNPILTDDTINDLFVIIHYELA